MSEIILQRRIFVVSLGFMLKVPNGLEIAVSSGLLVCMCHKHNLCLDEKFLFG